MHGRALYGAFPTDNDQRRHLRPAALPRLRAVRADLAVARALGRSAGGARRGRRVRRRLRRAAVPDRATDARHARWASCWPTPGSPSRSRSTRPTRGPTTRSRRRCCSPRLRAPAAVRRAARSVAAGGHDEVRAARAAAAVRRPRDSGRRRARSPHARLLRFCAGAGVVLARWRAARADAHRPAHVLGPHDRLPGRPRRAVLGLGPLRRRLGGRPSTPCRSSPSLLAAGIAFVPRRDDVVGLAALERRRSSSPFQLVGDVLVLPLPRVDRSRSR